MGQRDLLLQAEPGGALVIAGWRDHLLPVFLYACSDQIGYFMFSTIFLLILLLTYFFWSILLPCSYI